MIKSSIHVLITAVIFLLCGVNTAFAQCGADGKPPCNPTPKKTTPKKTTTKTTTKKPPTTVSQTQPKFVASAPEIEMVKIPSGSFMMGSENGSKDEKPAHRVNISKSFYMGKYEVTQAQWKSVMGNNPSSASNCGGNCPVNIVSWDDVQGFIRKLNDLQKKYKYRLPTEAEWEYACRAGTTGDYAGDLDSMAWYFLNAGGETHPVGQKSPNDFGLYDMHGNVAEWCEDRYGNYSSETVTDPTGAAEGSFRVYRGGGWYANGGFLRSANRNSIESTHSSGDLGFRLIRD